MFKVENSKRVTRANRGLGYCNFEAQQQSIRIAKEQLANLYWLVYFEDQSCSVVPAKANCVCLELPERVHVKTDEFINIRWHKKNPTTKSYIWTVRVLQLGHQDFCERWLGSACVQIEDASGNKSFAPIVPCVDPDLTIYEDIEQMLLSNNLGSQGAKRKLQLPSNSQEANREEVLSQNKYDPENVPSQHEPIEVLNPEDVSKTFSDLQESRFGQEEPNCSAIDGNEVNKLDYVFIYGSFFTKF